MLLRLSNQFHSANVLGWPRDIPFYRPAYQALVGNDWFKAAEHCELYYICDQIWGNGDRRIEFRNAFLTHVTLHVYRAQGSCGRKPLCSVSMVTFPRNLWGSLTSVRALCLVLWWTLTPWPEGVAVGGTCLHPIINTDSWKVGSLRGKVMAALNAYCSYVSSRISDSHLQSFKLFPLHPSAVLWWVAEEAGGGQFQWCLSHTNNYVATVSQLYIEQR